MQCAFARFRKFLLPMTGLTAKMRAAVVDNDRSSMIQKSFF
jgi:hypothetical protein